MSYVDWSIIINVTFYFIEAKKRLRSIKGTLRESVNAGEKNCRVTRRKAEFNWQIIHTHIDFQLNGIGDLWSASREISLASRLSFSRALVSAALKSHGVEGIRVNRSRIQKRKTRRAEIVCVNLTGIWIALKRSRRVAGAAGSQARETRRAPSLISFSRTYRSVHSYPNTSICTDAVPGAGLVQFGFYESQNRCNRCVANSIKKKIYIYSYTYIFFI